MTFYPTHMLAAREVMVGDYLYNNLAPFAELTGVRVHTVTQTENRVIIATSAWTTYKHPCEGIAIMRVPDPL
jgi:hypothetical protein